MRLFCRPFLQGLNGRLMLQSALRDMVVVGREIELQRRLKFVGRRESGLLDQVADSPVEALDHAVRLRMAGWRQTMLNFHFGTAHIEHVTACGTLVFTGKPIRELAAVVSENLLNLHRRGQLETAQEVGTADFGLVAVDAEVHPARRPVDGDKQIATLGLIGHLWQVFDVDVQEAGLIVLEGFERGWLAFNHGLKALQVRDAVAAQAPVQTRAGDRWIDELTRHCEKVVQRQQHHAPELDNEYFLSRRQRRMQCVRTMRPVLWISTALPLSGRRQRDVVLVGQLGQRCFGGVDFGACSRRRAGLGMDLTHRRCSLLNDSMTPRIRSRALNKGQLRTGT